MCITNSSKYNTNQPIIYFGFNDPREFKRGVENVIYLQASCFTQNKCIYIFFGKKKELFKWGNLICFSIPKNTYRFFSVNYLLYWLKKKYNTTLFIHSHNYLTSFFCIKKTDVFTVHDGLVYSKKQAKSAFIFFFVIIERITYWRSHKIHFISAYAKSKALYNSSKDVIIYNSSLLRVPVQIANNKQHNPIKKILIVRSIEERAALYLILQFAQHLQQHYGNSVVIEIAGKGPLLDYYKKQVATQQLKNVSFLGYITDDLLVEKYSECFLVMVPALYGEGFGLPVIEAYKFNKPVLASHVCAIPEVIISKKHLFNNTLPDIIDAFELFITDNAYLPNFRGYYNTHFSTELIKEKYLSLLYNDVR